MAPVSCAERRAIGYFLDNKKMASQQARAVVEQMPDSEEDGMEIIDRVKK
jgi:hypothetical protein